MQLWFYPGSRLPWSLSVNQEVHVLATLGVDLFGDDGLCCQLSTSILGSAPSSKADARVLMSTTAPTMNSTLTSLDSTLSSATC